MQTFTMLARRTLPTTQAVMPVLAFAASAALTLLVAGGIQAFHLWLGDPSLPGRGAQSRPSNYLQSAYILLAWASGFLLLTPLFTLGASAARLSARRRDDRLATLRLLGASTGRITLYTVADLCDRRVLHRFCALSGADYSVWDAAFSGHPAGGA